MAETPEARLEPGFPTSMLPYIHVARCKLRISQTPSALAKLAVQAAKHPDQKNDRQWDADEP
ncbi:MAG: hypothetical protein WBD90_02780 [Xanthobacteraceae bacterium]